MSCINELLNITLDRVIRRIISRILFVISFLRSSFRRDVNIYFKTWLYRSSKFIPRSLKKESHGCGQYYVKDGAEIIRLNYLKFLPRLF